MTTLASKDIAGVSPYVLALHQSLNEGGRAIARFAVGELDIEVRPMGDSLWALIRRPGKGRLALRAAYLAGPFACEKRDSEPGEAARIAVTGALSTHVISFVIGADALEHLHMTVTNEPVYLEQSYVYLGSFFHNSEIWESELELAVHYKNFLGVTCLQDAPYMAIYECFDSYAAFEYYLSDSGPDLEPAARIPIAEYCKYALDRAWYYYPDALPQEAISPTQREANGHVDRKLSFPLEDLYADGQPAGQVGQEIMVFATRSFHKIDGAPFLLFCDHFVRAKERTGDRALTLTLDGGETCSAGLVLTRLKRRKLSKVTVTTAGGDTLRPWDMSRDLVQYRVPANGRIVLTWE